MKAWRFYLLAILVLALDRMSKAWALTALANGNTIPLVPGFLNLSLVLNRGSAFGVVRQGSTALAIVALIAIGFMIYIERRGLPQRMLRVIVALQLGGALGNFYDRARFGHVVDFIELDWRGRNIWPVFNVADSAITIGTVMLIWWLWRQERKGSREDASPREAI